MPERTSSEVINIAVDVMGGDYAPGAIIDGVWDSGAAQEAFGENYACAKLPTVEIGGTTYEVSTHFSTEGKQSVLEQFMALLLSNHLA